MVFGYVYETGKRSGNEDALLFRSSLFAGGELLFMAVCDGMGGMENGAEASGFCIREMETWYDRQLLPYIGTCSRQLRDIGPALKSKGFCLYRQMNQALFQQMRCTGRKMGSTATMCIVYENRYYLFHVGDSRAYLLKHRMGNSSFRQLTIDHGNGNGLSRCMGLNKEWKPDFKTGRIGKKGMLLCSDGFYRQYKKAVWKGCLNPQKLEGEESIRKRLREIADYNMRQGEQDNISAIYMNRSRNERRESGKWSFRKSM